MTKLKTGGARRSIIIPEGNERYGWRAFGLELRKVLKPKPLGISVKGKITHKGEEKMGEKLRITGIKIGALPVRISEKMEGMGGRAVGMRWQRAVGKFWQTLGSESLASV